MTVESDLAENPDEIEALPEDDLAREAVQSVLEEMTSIYATDNETIPVTFGGRSGAPPGGNYVIVNPDLPTEMDPPVVGPNILRLLDDLLAHEVAHVNWTDLKAKQAFADCYPGWGDVPGHVQNILEDEYVDAKRQQQWYGMRSKLAYYVWLHMNTERRAPPVPTVEERRGRTNALMTAMFQTALAGYVKGDPEEIPDEILEFCSYADPLIKWIRGEDDRDERFKICHAMMQLLLRYAPDPDEFDPDEMADHRRDMHAGEGASESDTASAPDADEPEVDMPPDVEEAVEEMLSDLAADDNFPTGDDPTTDSDDAGSESADDAAGDGDESDAAGDSDDGESAASDDADGTDSTGDDEGRIRDISALVEEHGAANLTVVN